MTRKMRLGSSVRASRALSGCEAVKWRRRGGLRRDDAGNSWHRTRSSGGRPMTAPQYRTALIVGAGEGLSASSARLLAKAGLRVAVAARGVDKLAALSRELGTPAFACNAADADQVGRLLRRHGEANRRPGRRRLQCERPGARSPDHLVPAEVQNTLTVSAFGGFLVAQQAARRAQPPRHHPVHGSFGEREGLRAVGSLRDGKIRASRPRRAWPASSAPGHPCGAFVIDGAIPEPWPGGATRQA